MSPLSFRQPRRNGCDRLIWTQYGASSENYLTRYAGTRGRPVDGSWLDPTGEIEELSFEDTAQRLKDGVRPLLCHSPGTTGRLSLKRFQCFDVLELFAFVRPLDFCVPTSRGLGDALGIDVGPRPADAALGLVQATQALLNELADSDQVDARPVAWAMARGGWSWGPSVLAALGEEAESDPARSPAAGLDVWRRLRNGLSTRRHRRPRLMRSSRTRRAGV